MKWWFSIAFLFTQLIFLLLIITQNERLQNVAMTLVLNETGDLPETNITTGRANVGYHGRSGNSDRPSV
jgi:hypothetical protein